LVPRRKEGIWMKEREATWVEGWCCQIKQTEDKESTWKMEVMENLGKSCPAEAVEARETEK
jgi:hypothetical protein